MNIKSILLPLIICLIPLAAFAQASPQCPLITEIQGSYFLSQNTPPSLVGDQLGFHLVNTGDLDGDGIEDFAASSYRDIGAGSFFGAVKIWSGRSKTLLARIGHSTALSSSEGGIAGIGDLNNDGRGDILVSERFLGTGTSAPSGKVSAYSLHPQPRVLYTITAPKYSQYTNGHNYFGNSIVALGDLNGDGKSEFAVAGSDYADSNYNFSGLVFIYNGANGALLNTLSDTSGLTREFGRKLFALNDITGDGKKDLVVQATFYPSGANERGAIFIYSGALLTNPNANAIIDAIAPSQPFLNFGESIASLGDLNGDGLSEFAVSSPNALSEAPGPVLLVSPVRSGLTVTLNELGKINPSDGGATGFGQSIAAIKDQDGDGLPDLVVSSPEFNGGKADVFSTKTGQRLQTISAARAAGDRFGQALISIGDTNGDGYHEIVVSAPLSLDAVNFSTLPSNFTSGTGPQPGKLSAFSISPDNNRNGTPDVCEKQNNPGPGNNNNNNNNGNQTGYAELLNYRNSITVLLQQAASHGSKVKRVPDSKAGKSSKRQFKALINTVLKMVKNNPAVKNIDPDLTPANASKVKTSFSKATSAKSDRKTKKNAWKELNKTIGKMIA